MSFTLAKRVLILRQQRLDAIETIRFSANDAAFHIYQDDQAVNLETVNVLLELVATIARAFEEFFR